MSLFPPSSTVSRAASAAHLPVAGTTLSVSGVDPDGASLDEIGAVSERLRGLATIRGAGEPARLLRPRLQIDGVEIDLTKAFYSTLVADCIPRLDATVGDLQVSVTVACTPRCAGLLYHVALRATREVQATVEVEVAVAQAQLALTSARPLGHALYCEVDPETRTLLVEALGGADSIAAAFTSSEPDVEMRVEPVEGEAPPTGPASSVIANDGARPLVTRFVRRCALAPGTTQELNLLATLALERDGARAAAVAIRQSGPARILAEAEQEARRLLLRLPSLPPATDSRVVSRYQQNALFCYDFATADAIDSGKVVGVVSRSSHHPLCGLTVEREVLLWALPVVTWLNPPRARALLLGLCASHACASADALRYVDGARFAPGSLLDNLCAYPIALSRYLTTTGDRAIVHHPAVVSTLELVRVELARRRHRDLALFRTELTPSGRPAPLPYMTYCNALAWRAFVDLGWIGAESRHRDHAVAEEIRHAVYEELVDRDRGCFQLAADLDGDSVSGDDPAGSLLWLTALGFCREDDPVFARTVQALYDDDGARRLKGRFPGARLPGIAAAAALATLGPTLFTSRSGEAVEVIGAAPLSAGLACDAYDPTTGGAASGPHRATLAGLLAWSLAESRALVD